MIGQDTSESLSRAIHASFSKSFKLIHIGTVEHGLNGLGFGVVNLRVLHQSLVGGGSDVEAIIADQLLGDLSWLAEVGTKRGRDTCGVERADVGFMFSQLHTIE